MWFIRLLYEPSRCYALDVDQFSSLTNLKISTCACFISSISSRCLILLSCNSCNCLLSYSSSFNASLASIIRPPSASVVCVALDLNSTCASLYFFLNSIQLYEQVYKGLVMFDKHAWDRPRKLLLAKVTCIFCVAHILQHVAHILQHHGVAHTLQHTKNQLYHLLVLWSFLALANRLRGFRQWVLGNFSSHHRKILGRRWCHLWLGALRNFQMVHKVYF